jgi:formylglycine-generating enzyme required for sulfatase activity
MPIGKPFENSLGMKFLPVPGTDVLFSIWDTRVQDYQAFAAATGRSEHKAKFEQGSTHPVVGTSWDEAKAFCAWLTEKERRAGTLKSNQEYRLPTDLEWSTAVGLGKETGSTPEERSQKVEGVYPWGTQWPPPRGAGNYNPIFNVDDFEYTSPVGNFAANQFGLYDMGGNVGQLCEDCYDTDPNHHVDRGCSYRRKATRQLLSSSRIFVRSPTLHDQALGFRCVLAGASSGDASR